MMHAIPASLVLTALMVASGTLPIRSKAPTAATKPVVTGAASKSTSSRSVPARPAGSARPDFSGRWVLDMKQSEFGSLPGSKPLARTDTITHREPEISHVLYLVNPASRDTTTYRYRTNGETTHSTVDGLDVQSVARWDGRALKIDSKMRVMIFDTTLNDRWELSANGDTLKMTRHLKSPMGSTDQRLIFARR